MVLAMTDFETLWSEEFVTCLFDVAPVAVWREAMPGEPVRYVLDVPEGTPVPEAVLTAALATIPEGEPWHLLSL